MGFTFWVQVAAPIVSAMAVVIFGFYSNRRLAGEAADRSKAAQESSQRATRRTDYLRDQIQKLYGPLAFLMEASSNHFGAGTDLMVAYQELYSGLRANAPEQEMKDAIAVHNDFGALVVENNARVEKLLETQWGWLDSEDIDDALNYLKDVVRQRVEGAEHPDGKRKLSPELYNKGIVRNALRPALIFRSDFATRIRIGLDRKQAELSGLIATDKK